MYLALEQIILVINMVSKICLTKHKLFNTMGLLGYLVGMTGFEPATPRTPCVCATRLRHIPN